ncbi:SDR family NAD(P)-dependent oxidoreductase [Raineyella fluvialis]|uniref:SDR family NAD(P)-dependent oxidoreductase n=1 Tax=Raineyella fluvialis TaxID=2662261 RepID=A0A5Q2FB81_9ACTN|nr:SDR family NAD(P)-dependent oxidoreductase [Raineyella fluvialis]QGF24132.1 SDR family NAD(P)-dependent oxidoreductase [Raineyella fluvialis]
MSVPPGAVVIFGGRSEIGLAVARRLAPGRTVVLAARPGEMAGPRQVCLDAGADRVEVVEFDADDIAGQTGVVDRIEQSYGPIGVAVLAFGVLGDQELAETDPGEVARILHTDFVAQASLLTVLASRMRPRGRGTLVAFSSVAGVRVRRANYVYGSAKAGLDGFASGLADALHGSGVHLVVARPGFVVGRMTEGMDPAVFSSTPDQVADAVEARITQGRRVDLWIPWQLRVMFSVAPFVPRAVWRRMPR